MLSLDVPEFVRRLEEVGEELGYESINATSLSQMMQVRRGGNVGLTPRVFE